MVFNFHVSLIKLSYVYFCSLSKISSKSDKKFVPEVASMVKVTNISDIKKIKEHL